MFIFEPGLEIGRDGQGHQLRIDRAYDNGPARKCRAGQKGDGKGQAHGSLRFQRSVAECGRKPKENWRETIGKKYIIFLTESCARPTLTQT